MSSDIPLEPSSEEWPQDAMPDIALHLSNTQSFEATKSAFPSPTSHLFDLDVQIRAHTQPPEDLHPEPPPVETRHPCDPRHSYRPRPPAQPQHLRPDPPQQPWTETTSTSPTTSSLTPKNAAPSNYPDLPTPPQRIPHTSFSLHLESQLAHLQHVISSMQAYLSQSYKSPDENDQKTAVENGRHLARSVNRTLTELDEPLVALPRHPESTAPENPTPSTAAEIRKLNHTSIDPLLDSYDIAFTPTMFLWEKKAIYLRFIGAGRALMHRVLD
ncbi:hypothetical protein MMC30_004979 [Trapelia coarctata]|nr:hypothetical protein [Trapelia coarctata]